MTFPLNPANNLNTKQILNLFSLGLEDVDKNNTSAIFKTLR